MEARTLFLLIAAVLTVTTAHFGGLRYTPNVGNIAIGRTINASSTCGLYGPEQYCTTIGENDECNICNNESVWYQHTARSMIDRYIHSTWWQSSTNTSVVNIQLDLESIFFFNHIIITFKSLRPAGMSIYKSINYGQTYEPLMYYSNDCQRDFGLPPYAVNCTSIYSLPSQGEVIYTTPTGSVNLSDHLNHFIITNLRIHLLRFHSLSYGSDVSSEQVAVRNYYAISNIDIFGWCYCSGLEESSCLRSKEESIEMVPSMCSCSNNTTGSHCEQCLPLYNKLPWRNGFNTEYNGCPDKCDCNNRSNVCSYDTLQGIYTCLNCTQHTTGPNCQYCTSGYYQSTNGSCIECNCHPDGILLDSVCNNINGSCRCRDNVEGERCDRCKDGFYNLSSSNPLGCQECSCASCDQYTGKCPCTGNDTCCPYTEYNDTITGCISCECHVNGSYNGVCTDSGQCICKPGVTGMKCDQCLPGYYSLSSQGCLPCKCNQYGSRNDTCNSITGQCDCLTGVSGRTCNKCPTNSLGPVRNGALVCIPCYCSGHSVQCVSEIGWYWSLLNLSNEWINVNPLSIFNNKQLITSTNNKMIIINFPESYLGDKHTSYGLRMSLTFSLPYDSTNSIYLELFSIVDRIPTRIRTSLSLTTTNHTIPLIASSFMKQRFAMYTPLTEEYILRQLLANLISIKLIVRFGSDVPIDNRYINISDVSLSYATNNLNNPHLITPLIRSSVKEHCTCPLLYTGTDCGSCAVGYSKDPPYGNQFERCGTCHCNGLAESCDPISNECINCMNHTTDIHCTDCIVGYYRNNTSCLPCNCPGGPNARNQFTQSCDLIGEGVVCRNCPIGFTGDHCERCDDGYYGNPNYENGTCRICTCNNNTAEERCDVITGQCICADGYVGRECEYCQIGYYGNALLHDCQECNCHYNGSISGTYCNIDTGQCVCAPNVQGVQCNECVKGYWNINESCTLQCNCSMTGSSITDDCNKLTGQCMCNEGYTGLMCTSCDDGYWLYNGACIACNCNKDSSISTVCNKSNGQCVCLQGVTGKQCDMCHNNNTVRLLPYCEQCDECSTRWIGPINDLEILVSNVINNASSLTQINITHTELIQGQQLITPITDLINIINDNLTDYNTVLQHTLRSHSNITNLIQVMRNLILRGYIVQSSLTNITNTFTEQKDQLFLIKTELTLLCDLLSLLISQTNNITVNDLNTYNELIQSSLLSSNQSQFTVQDVIVPLLEDSQQHINQFIIKENQFINTSQDIVQLLTLLRNKLRNYQSLIISADQLLCGKNIENILDSLQCGCYGNPERCSSQCGGIGCGQCGGPNCNGTISELQNTYELSELIIKQLTQFNETLKRNIEHLRQANVSSNQAQILSVISLELSQNQQRNITLLLSLISSLTSDVNSIINQELLNISYIEDQTDETLSLKLSKTQQEVIQLLLQINNTIQMFPSIPEYSNLLMRAQKTLNVSLQANQTIQNILQNISQLLQTFDRLTNRTSNAQTSYNIISKDTNQLQLSINKVEQRLSLTESRMTLLSQRIQSLNSSFQNAKETFERNRQNLTKIRNTLNSTLYRVTTIEETSTRVERTREELTNQTTAKRESAAMTLTEIQSLRERMRRIRSEIHNQLLHTKSLQNRKTCLLKGQEIIRDDIKRVGAELETLHTDIQTHIGRNTLCMKKLLSSK